MPSTRNGRENAIRLVNHFLNLCCLSVRNKAVTNTTPTKNVKTGWTMPLNAKTKAGKGAQVDCFPFSRREAVNRSAPKTSGRTVIAD